MHFRLGSASGTIDLDDIRVVDLDDDREVIPLDGFEEENPSLGRRWLVWPPGASNTVGTVAIKPGSGRDGSSGLHVELRPPADGRWPDFHLHHVANLKLIEGHRHLVSFWVATEQGRELTVGFYRPGDPYVSLGGPPGPFENQIRLAAAVGVDFVSLPIELPWPRPGQPENWRTVDAACEQVLQANPRALLLPRLDMSPPSWWQEEHEDEVMCWENGRRGHAVVASPFYRHDAASRLRLLVNHLESRFGEHVAGYHPCGQNTGEWFYEGTWDVALNGGAPADERAWRLWLKDRYGSDQLLRASWHDATTDLETVAVPSPARRHASSGGLFRDPVRERDLTDWAEFQQQAMSQCVLDLARAAREASRGRKLIVFFSGYIFEFAAVPNGPGVSGHYALRRLLDSPDIDVLCSPISYFDRGLGQSAPAMTAAESVALAGKLWLYEDDTRTYLGTGNFPGALDAVYTLEDTNKELIRNVGQEAVRNFGTWWMDLGATGWFNDSRMWAEMARLKAIDEPLLARPIPFRPEVAAVIDERSMLRVAPAGVSVTRPGIYEARAALGRMGAPYGQYLQDDVMADRVHARLYVMLNAWNLAQPARARLLNRLRGKTVIWCVAPGYLDDGAPSLEAMRELTGFKLVPCSAAKPLASPTASGRKLGLARPFGSENVIRPSFAATDLLPDEILATYPDGTAAVAFRRGCDGVQVFVGVPGLTSELLRLAAREAGVHLFTETDCNVYASGPYVVLHAANDGPVDLRLPPGAAGSPVRKDPIVTDLLTGKAIGQGRSFRLPLSRGDTRVLRYE
jgi:hypothetical protein